MIISTEAVDYTYERRLELVARDSKAEGRTEGITEGLERGRKESEAKIAKSEAKIAELTAKLEAAGIKP